MLSAGRAFQLQIDDQPGRAEIDDLCVTFFILEENAASELLSWQREELDRL
jgi:hypothetical protein